MDCDKCTDLSNRHYNKHRKNTVKQSSHTSHNKCSQNNNNNEVKPRNARKWSHSDLHFGINLIYETPLPQSDNEVI